MANKTVDFSDMTEADTIRLLVATAVTASQTVEAVRVTSGKTKGGEEMIFIAISGYRYQDGDIAKVQAKAEVTNGE